jgi:SAM-dependent methyltransferase
MSPLCQRHVRPAALNQMEPFYPLHVRVCGQCFLVQLEEYVSPKEIFNDYAYFSSYSDTMLAHAKAYCQSMRDRLGLGEGSLVVELASNDGYLLQYFRELGIGVLGIEPAANVAEAAVAKGIPTVTEFFGVALAQKLAPKGKADLIVGNNVLAHVPDINDFVGGMRVLLKPGGVVTMEFPHLLRLLLENQFDTIYHEHFSYISFVVAERVFAKHGLTLFDVDEIPTHGGSLRIYARHAANTQLAVTEKVGELSARERAAGLERAETYHSFAEQVRATKRSLLKFLIQAKEQGKRVVGYGAPAKGNTLLNYCGVRSDLLEFTVDRSPHKQGRFLPGVHIPILAPEAIAQARPDYVLILPWNLQD